MGPNESRLPHTLVFFHHAVAQTDDAARVLGHVPLVGHDDGLRAVHHGLVVEGDPAASGAGWSTSRRAYVPERFVVNF